MHNQPGNSKITLSDDPLRGGLGNLVVSEIRHRDGTGCTISLNCPLKLDGTEGGFLRPNGKLHMEQNEPGRGVGLNLTLTLTSFDWETSNRHGCKDKLDALLYNNQKEAMGEESTRLQYLSLLKQSKDETRQHDSEPLQKHLQPRKPVSISDTQDEQRFNSVAPILDHPGLIDYFLSSVSQRRAIQEAVNVVKTAKHRFREVWRRTQLPELRHHSIRSPGRWNEDTSSKTTFGDRSTCEKTFCTGYNLKKICDQHKRPSVEIDAEIVCRMCYPKKDHQMVKEHCEERERKEIKAFHMLCVALGMLTAVAAILYLIREICRPLKKRCQIIWKVRTGQISKSPVLASRFSSIFSMESSPGFAGPLFDRETEPAQNEPEMKESPNTFTMVQQKLSYLGFMSREPRKRVQGVFDLESLQSSHPTEPFDGRVPVLPRASNSSMKRHFRERCWLHESSTQDSSDGLVPIHNTQEPVVPPHYVS